MMIYLQVDNWQTAAGQISYRIDDGIIYKPKYVFIGNNGTFTVVTFFQMLWKFYR